MLAAWPVWLCALLGLAHALANYSIAVEDKHGMIVRMGDLLVHTHNQSVFNFTLTKEAEDAKVGVGCVGVLDFATFECHTRIRTARAQAYALRAVLYPNGTLEQVQLMQRPPDAKINHVQLVRAASVPRPQLRGRAAGYVPGVEAEEEPSFLQKNWMYLLIPFGLTIFLRYSQSQE